MEYKVKDDSLKEIREEFEETLEKHPETIKEKCIVCGEKTLCGRNVCDICACCGWTDTDMQDEDFPDEDNLVNIMSLNQAREAYKNGKRAY